MPGPRRRSRPAASEQSRTAVHRTNPVLEPRMAAVTVIPAASSPSASRRAGAEAAQAAQHAEPAATVSRAAVVPA